MPTVDPKPGMFGWTDLSTTDPDGARDFYAALFGWTYDVQEGDFGVYSMCRKNGVNVAGLAGQSPEQAEAGVPPMWNSYVHVDDVDGVTRRAKEMGAGVHLEPMDVMDVGRMSVIRDPTGGVLCLWQERKSPGPTLFNEPGAMCWNELATRDQAGAADFYGELLGWTYEEMETPGGPYRVIHNDGRPNGGILQMNEQWPDEIPPHWMVYFWVDDVEAAAEEVDALGGGVNVEPMDIGVGQMSVVQDPQGAVFTLFRAEEGPST